MDNDPSKLEEFVYNEANKDMLLKHGIIVEQQPPKKSEIQELTETLRETLIKPTSNQEVSNGKIS